MTDIEVKEKKGRGRESRRGRAVEGVDMLQDQTGKRSRVKGDTLRASAHMDAIHVRFVGDKLIEWSTLHSLLRLPFCSCGGTRTP